MEKIQGNLWVYLLFIAPFFFASLYSEDKEYVSKLLASAPLSDRRLVTAKIVWTLLLASIIYWIPLGIVWAHDLILNPTPVDFSLPYAMLAPRTALDAFSISSGLIYLFLLGYVEMICLGLLFLLISQMSQNTITATFLCLAPAVVAYFGPAFLLSYFPQSVWVSYLFNFLLLTPVGFLSSQIPNDIYLMDNNFLKLGTLASYHLQAISSLVLIGVIVFLLYFNGRRCFRQI